MTRATTPIKNDEEKKKTTGKKIAMNNRSNAGGFPLSFAAPPPPPPAEESMAPDAFIRTGDTGALHATEKHGAAETEVGPPPLAASDGAIGRGDRRTKLRPPRNPGIFRRGGSSFPALSRRKERKRERGGGSDGTAEEDLLVGNQVLSSQRISLGFSDRRSDRAQRQAERKRGA